MWLMTREVERENLINDKKKNLSYLSHLEEGHACK